MAPLKPTDRRTSPNHSSRGRNVVSWLCIHWSGGRYEPSADWICQDVSDVSYHRLIGPSGEICDAVPWSRCAWAVGYCRNPEPRLPWTTAGNSTSESISLAGGPGFGPVTGEQRELLIVSICERFRAHGWGAHETYRILGHDQVAVFGPGHPRAGQYGRKPDPQDQGWLPLQPIRDEVARRLGSTPSSRMAPDPFTSNCRAA